MIRIGVLLLVTTCAWAGCEPASLSNSTDKVIGTVVVDRPVGSARLVISYYGDPPQLLSQTRIRGNGISAHIQRADGTDLWGAGAGEADSAIAIEFGRAPQGEVQILYYTRDPRQPYEDYVPFIRETIRVKSGTATVAEQTILLEKEAFDPAKAEALAASAKKAIKSKESDNLDSLGTALGTLRNMGVDSPEAILRVLDGLSRTADGHCAEMINTTAQLWLKLSR